MSTSKDTSVQVRIAEVVERRVERRRDSDMWLGGLIFEKSEFPSSHRREEGWRHQEKGAKPPYGRRRGGVPCPSYRNTTPSSRKADATRYSLDRSATPPRGDARRGIRHFENSPQLGQQCLQRGTPIFLGCSATLIWLPITSREMYGLAEELRVHCDLVKPQFFLGDEE